MGLFFKKWHVAGNNDNTSMDYNSSNPLPIHVRFPTLKIREDGKKAEIFHMPSNTWSGTTVKYALENGTSWPSELLRLPELKGLREQIDQEHREAKRAEEAAKKQGEKKPPRQPVAA